MSQGGEQHGKEDFSYTDNLREEWEASEHFDQWRGCLANAYVQTPSMVFDVLFLADQRGSDDEAARAATQTET